MAKLEARGPRGGGHYKYCDAVSLGKLRPGYYRVHVDFTNINYTESNNIARLAVEVNNKQITLGALHTSNLITAAQAQKLLANYMPVDFNHKKPGEVWAYVGGDFLAAHEAEKKQYTQNGVYDEVAHKLRGAWYNTCALRVSVGLSDSGIVLKDEQNLGMKGDAHLGPDGRAIVAASTMTKYFERTFGAADFASSEHYKYGDPANDTICFGGSHLNSPSGHVGFGTDTKAASGGGITEKIWILHRSTWGEPEQSKINI